MKKISSLKEINSEVKLICWDLDGTLLDTETMWYNMDKLVMEKYGNEITEEEKGKFSEKIAANAYKNLGYRANADKALNYLKKNNIYQVLVNKCDLTNITLVKNKTINNTFPLDNFDGIVSEKSFKDKFTDEDMYKKALDIAKVTEESKAVAICDMPFELKIAKNIGIITVWAKNDNYPFTEDELEKIEKVADYYIEDFSDLIK